MTSAFRDEYHNGEIVQCQRCAKNIRVKYFDRETVVIVSTQEQQTLALRCQNCGYVMCDSCAHPADSLFPVCPSCRKEWGPYYFTHDAIVPIIDKKGPAVETPPPAVDTAQPLPTADVQETPIATVDTLAAGEVDFLREELDRKHHNISRIGLTIALTVVLVGLIAFIAFGNGGSKIRKGLRALSAQPTRGVTSEANRIIVPIQETATRTKTPIHLNTPTAQKFSPTPSTNSESGSSDKTEIATSPNFPSPTATPTSLPTATLAPSSTSTALVFGSGDCVPALDVTLDDVGKTLCVKGVVVFTTQKSNAFSIYFSKDEGFFRIVVYDRVPKGVEEGVCVQVTGEIKVLLNSPVIAPAYKDVIDICSP